MIPKIIEYSDTTTSAMDREALTIETGGDGEFAGQCGKHTRA